MDRKLIAIVCLGLTAAALLAANLFVPSPASANDAVNGRDFQVATAQITSGGEGLYVIDGRTGLMAIFTYDPNSRALQARDVRPVADAFPGGR